MVVLFELEAILDLPIADAVGELACLLGTMVYKKYGEWQIYVHVSQLFFLSLNSFLTFLTAGDVVVVHRVSISRCDTHNVGHLGAIILVLVLLHSACFQYSSPVP